MFLTIILEPLEFLLANQGKEEFGGEFIDTVHRAMVLPIPLLPNPNDLLIATLRQELLTPTQDFYSFTLGDRMSNVHYSDWVLLFDLPILDRTEELFRVIHGFSMHELLPMEFFIPLAMEISTIQSVIKLPKYMHFMIAMSKAVKELPMSMVAEMPCHMSIPLSKFMPKTLSNKIYKAMSEEHRNECDTFYYDALDDLEAAKDAANFAIKCNTFELSELSFDRVSDEQITFLLDSSLSNYLHIIEIFESLF